MCLAGLCLFEVLSGSSSVLWKWVSLPPIARRLRGECSEARRTLYFAHTHEHSARCSPVESKESVRSLLFLSLQLKRYGKEEKKKSGVATSLQVIVTLRQKILFHVRRRLDNHILFGFQSFFGSAVGTKVEFAEQRFSFHHLSRAAKSHITRN